VQIAVARVLLVDPEPLGRSDDVGAVERTDPQVAERPLDPGLERVQADVLDEQPQEVLVREWAGGILFIPEALAGEVAVDLLAVFGVRVESLLVRNSSHRHDSISYEIISQ
jgi:hypothetical protein